MSHVLSICHNSTSNQRSNPLTAFEALPEDVLFEIFAYLLPADIICLRLTSRRLAEATSYNTIWRCQLHKLKFYLPIPAGCMSMPPSQAESCVTTIMHVDWAWRKARPNPATLQYSPINSRPYAPYLTPDGRSLLVIAWSGAIIRWDLNDPKPESRTVLPSREDDGEESLGYVSMNVSDGEIVAVIDWMHGETPLSRLDVWTMPLDDPSSAALHRGSFSMPSDVGRLELSGDFIVFLHDSYQHAYIINWREMLSTKPTFSCCAFDFNLEFKIGTGFELHLASPNRLVCVLRSGILILDPGPLQSVQRLPMPRDGLRKAATLWRYKFSQTPHNIFIHKGDGDLLASVTLSGWQENRFLRLWSRDGSFYISELDKSLPRLSIIGRHRIVSSTFSKPDYTWDITCSTIQNPEPKALENPLPVHVPHQATVSIRYNDVLPSRARNSWTLFSEASARVCVVGLRCPPNVFLSCAPNPLNIFKSNEI